MLKTSFSKNGLSEKDLNGLADIVLAKVDKDTTAEALQSEIDAVEPFVKLMQSAADQARKAKKADDSEKKEEEKTGAESSNDDSKKEQPDVPAWAKALIDSNKALQDKLAAIEQGKTTETREVLYAKSLEGLPDKLKESKLNAFKRMNFTDDDDFKSFNEAEAEANKEFVTTQKSQQAGQFGAAFHAGGNNGSKKASDADLNSVLTNILPNN